jgi:hypothetical protein
MKYTIKFGMARAYYTPELPENTRSKTFTNRKKAESYWDRLDKFTFKDPSKPTWELRVMIRALSMMPSLNTEAENERLEEAKEELRRRQA